MLPPNSFIGAGEAVAASVGIGCLYVGSLYAIGNRRLVRCQWNRNHPEVIVDRLRAASVVTVLLPIMLWALFAQHGLLGHVTSWSASMAAMLRLLGVGWTSARQVLAATLLPLLHTMLLFLGPLVSEWQTGELKTTIRLLDFSNADTTQHLISLRNYVVGPISEEIVFRACLGALLAQTHMSTTAAVLSSSLIFAHAHHAWEMYARNRHRPNALRVALAQTAFQLFYCAVFGSYTMMLFLRTGHVLGAILSHAFCNIMGLPDIGQLFTESGRLRMLSVYLLGIALFVLTYTTLLDPTIYDSVYWTVVA
ncbi:hypothetical protein THASP1DRAFT_29322 [Thamnocephalis sphaerospora]|uniref:intramembrane prenyl-peptidase Rce1 n=1 Tax=Thamnocephalis sphaerospora TaxID=78915 RepID=A0A4P9XS03_9FUNG|nr:hypothetical protein THASP1DRAFT_29322 [Thamnocephalis sphaerospora]|eukprot:RKP08885.1 hypothetical protein THASP1DRAFT_29322 [Thamnocephalis sphaerospora]